ncbi:MAG TPA: hypothetical protein VN816_08165 [Acidimicrobiales bacterium]|nr:hypothetical protein [Acidimicrobiales bacterium]
MTTKRLGRGLGVASIVLAVVGVFSVTASADSTCYTGCTPPTTVQTQSGGGTGGQGGSGGTRPPVTKSSGGSGSSGSGSGSSGGGARTTAQTGSSGGSLPFTGADVEELTAGGLGALLVGGALLRRSRNRRRAEA